MLELPEDSATRFVGLMCFGDWRMNHPFKSIEDNMDDIRIFFQCVQAMESPIDSPMNVVEQKRFSCSDLQSQNPGAHDSGDDREMQANFESERCHWLIRARF